MARLTRDDTGRFPSWAWPGGYPIFYLCNDGGVLCPACANRENGSEAYDVAEHPQEQFANNRDGWGMVACDVHYEGEPLICDHCGAEIKSAYGPTDDDA